MKILSQTFVFTLFLAGSCLFAQHTFSIVAVDSVTKEVGGAGATCLSLDREGYEALIISDIYPGLGAIHTQSYWDPTNQYNAGSKALEGLTAPEIIEWLVQNDIAGNPGIRQYGVALLRPDGSNTTAAYTGSACLDTKYHVTGRNYTIQGNILIGKQVIDSMEKHFLAAQGSLADRLMEAMRGAKIPGADKRCLSEGLSSRSSFLRVARPTDTASFYLDIHVGSTRAGLDPIDSLDLEFRKWKNQSSTTGQIRQSYQMDYLQASRTVRVMNDGEPAAGGDVMIYDIGGRLSRKLDSAQPGLYKIPDSITDGIYIVQYAHQSRVIITKKIKIQ